MMLVVLMLVGYAVRLLNEMRMNYAERHLIEDSAAIPGRRRGQRLRPVVRTATRHRVLMVRLVVRLLVVDAVVHLRRGGRSQVNYPRRRRCWW